MLLWRVAAAHFAATPLLFPFCRDQSQVLLIAITRLLKITGGRGKLPPTFQKNISLPQPAQPYWHARGVLCARPPVCVCVRVSRESFKPVQVCPGERQCTAPDGQVAAEITGEIETLSDRQPCIRREHTCHRKVDKHTLVDAAQKRPLRLKKTKNKPLKIKNEVTHLSVMRVLLLSTCPRPMKWNQGTDAEPPSASSDSLKTFQLPTFTQAFTSKKKKKK